MPGLAGLSGMPMLFDSSSLNVFCEQSVLLPTKPALNPKPYSGHDRRTVLWLGAWRPAGPPTLLELFAH